MLKDRPYMGSGEIKNEFDWLRHLGQSGDIAHWLTVWSVQPHVKGWALHGV